MNSKLNIFEFLCNISPLLWGIVVIIAVSAIYQWRSMNEKKKHILSAIGKFKSALPESGLSQNAPHIRIVGDLNHAFAEASGLPFRWWHRLEQHLQGYTGRSPQEVTYLTVAAAEALPESEVLDPHFPAGWFHVVPGLLTSVGLAATFFAILLGLSGVKPDPNIKGAFEGIDGLICSLGGKFITSIVAILAGAFFTIMERRAEGELNNAYDSLTQRVAQAFPLLTPSRILVDIHRSASEREKALRNISSEVVDQLRDVFTKDISPGFADGMAGMVKPSLERMAQTLVNLEAAIQGMGSIKPMRDLQEQMAEMSKSMMNQFDDVQSQAGTRAAEEVGRIALAVHAAETQIAKLMDLLGSRSQDLAHLGSQLEHAGENLNGLLQGASAAASSMTSAAAAFESSQAGLTDSVNAAKSTTIKQGETLLRLEELFRQIQTQYENGGILLNQYRETFNTAQNQLSHLDQDLGEAFTVVHSGMEAWTQGVDNTLRQLTARTNEHMGGIAAAMGVQLQTLSENLQEFNDTLYQVIEQGRK